MLILLLLFSIACLFLLLNIQYWKISIAAFQKQFLSLKTWCFHFLGLYIKSLQKLQKRLHHSISPISQELFESLTPTEDGDDYDIYEKALNFSLLDKDIRNIALTGPYGSGKSTILKTFQKNHKEYDYLNISLASFRLIKDEDDPENELIEVSILQQIFYHVKHSVIPDSRFKRIRKASKAKLLLKAALLLICCGCFWFLTQSSPLPAIPESDTFLKNFRFYLLVIAMCTLSLGTLYLVYTVFKLYNNSKFNKVNLSSGEIELSDHSDASILNKHLDEIIYFFEVTAYNVIIIEDLDRFQNPEIFTKLREINNLINNSKQVMRRVVFIYALKDDIFTDEKRTKFFDFVIPVIPVINSSNSEAKLLERLETAEVFPELSREFVSEIALYINDMRLLKNIFNEFVIYKAKLGTFELNPNHLLATILYKNLYPTDFADLNKGEGLIFGFFSKKALYIEMITKAKRERLNFIQSKQESLRVSAHKDKYELRSIYISKLFQMLPSNAPKEIYMGTVQVSFEELSTDSNFNKLKVEGTIYYISTNGYGRQSSGLNFNSIEKQVAKDQTYDEREQEILSRAEYFSEQIKKEVETIQAELQELSILPFSKIIADISDDELDHGITNSDILLFLIRNGYINEDYHDFTSHFYEGTLTRKDKTFLLSIKNHKSLTPDFILDNPFQLIEAIKLHEFGQYEVLNYALLDNLLLQVSNSSSNKLDAFLKLIISNTNTASQFRDSYIEKGKQVSKFIKALLARWPEFWDFIVIESGFSDEKKRQYLKLILDHADLKTIQSLNSQGNLKQFISKENGFLSMMQNSNSPDKIKTILKLLDIKFIDLDIVEGQTEYFEVIYENDFYKLNVEMIHKVLFQKEIEPEVPSDIFLNANFSTIQDSQLVRLIGYVNRNLDDYIEDVFLTISSQNEEPEEILVNFYNDDDIDLDNRIKIIEQQNTIIDNINPVNDFFWSYLLKERKISPKWSNLFMYFQKKNDLDLHLLNFLNLKANFEHLSELKVTEIDSEPDDVEKFALAIVNNQDITVESFKCLISSFPYAYTDLEVSHVHPDKVSFMIDHKFLVFSYANYKMLKDDFNGKNISLAEKFPEEFLAEYSNLNLDSNDYLLILKSQEFTYDQKITVLKTITVDKLKDNEELNSSSIELLYDQYQDINHSVLNQLLGAEYDLERKVSLLNKHMRHLNPDQITASLRALDGKYAAIADKSEPRLDPSNTNKEFAHILDDLNYVSSVTIKDDFVRLNHFKGNH